MLLYHTARRALTALRVFLLFPRNVENKDAMTVKLSVFLFWGKREVFATVFQLFITLSLNIYPIELDINRKRQNKTDTE